MTCLRHCSRCSSVPLSSPLHYTAGLVYDHRCTVLFSTSTFLSHCAFRQPVTSIVYICGSGAKTPKEVPNGFGGIKLRVAELRCDRCAACRFLSRDGLETGQYSKGVFYQVDAPVIVPGNQRGGRLQLKDRTQTRLSALEAWCRAHRRECSRRNGPAGISAISVRFDDRALGQGAPALPKLRAKWVSPRWWNSSAIVRRIKSITAIERSYGEALNTTTDNELTRDKHSSMPAGACPGLAVP